MDTGRVITTFGQRCVAGAIATSVVNWLRYAAFEWSVGALPPSPASILTWVKARRGYPRCA